MLTRPSWFHASKSMDELHPPTCHVIWGCGIGIMTIFQLYYNQCSIGTCHVIEERHGILNFWLLFNYIITNGTLTCVTWAFVVHHQTKLFDVPCVWSQNLEIIDLLNMLKYDIVPHGHLCYTLAWHMVTITVNFLLPL